MLLQLVFLQLQKSIQTTFLQKPSTTHIFVKRPDIRPR